MSTHITAIILFSFKVARNHSDSSDSYSEALLVFYMQQRPEDCMRQLTDIHHISQSMSLMRNWKTNYRCVFVFSRGTCAFIQQIIQRYHLYKNQ